MKHKGNTMKKKSFFSSLTTKIPAQLIALLLIIMASLSSAVIYMSRSATSASIHNEVNYLAEMNAAKVDSYLENMNAFSHALSKEVRHYSQLSRTDAEPILIETLEGVLENDKIFGAYFAFEPNRYFPETPAGLSYYAYRDDGKIHVDILNDYAVYSTGDYYTGARDSMQTYVTEPYPYELTNGSTVYLITLSTPVTDTNGKFLGVANCDILADSINSISFNQGGYETAYSTILSAEGMYIADSADSTKLGSYLDAQSNDGQAISAAVQQGQPLLMTGKNEHFSHKDAIISYIPITLSGTNLRWSSGFIVNRSEVFSSQNHMTVVILLTCILGVLLLSAFTYSIIKRSLSPISYVMNLAEKMHRCDLTKVENHTKLSNDELGQLAHLFTETSDDLATIINDINYCLNQMAAGNFRVDSQCEDRYVGEYRHILRDMKKIRGNLSETLLQIEVASDQVQSGSEQVAQGAQALAQGSTEQASSIEELVSTIADLSDRIKNNADDAKVANTIAEEAGTDVTESNQHMQELLAAMSEINDTSTEIGKIIQTIDNIAFQTNILALNAAVEAARAGVAGKGFAVVADEVRNLASKSAEAAKNTTALIENSVLAVENGSKLANATAASLEKVVERVQDVEGKIKNIADASEEQASSVAQIEQGIDQISAVVQTNSATAEESAAASEELSGQANMLKSMMAQFTLRDDTADQNASF